jgi:hypothetical protein
VISVGKQDKVGPYRCNRGRQAARLLNDSGVRGGGIERLGTRRRAVSESCKKEMSLDVRSGADGVNEW